jgi:hypothetical protein
MDREKRIVQLSSPIQAHGKDITELTILEHTGRELEAMDRGVGPIQKFNHLIAACANIPYPSVLQLRGADWNACVGAMEEMGFQLPTGGPSESSPGSQETGGIPSE